MLTACYDNSTNVQDANGQGSIVTIIETNIVPKFDEAEHNTAGGMTTRRLYASYIYPGNNVSRDLQLNFWTGFSLFRDPWVAAPSATGQVLRISNHIA